MSTLESGSTSAATEEECVEPSASNSNGGTSESASAETRDDPEPLTKDVIFDILKNQRRRRVLGYLRKRRTSTLSDVAEHVAALENEKEVESLTSSERKRVYVGLYQCHLPRMSDAGIIEFNQARGTIELREATDIMFLYLDLDIGGNPTGSETGWRQFHERLPSISSVLGH